VLVQDLQDLHTLRVIASQIAQRFCGPGDGSLRIPELDAPGPGPIPPGHYATLPARFSRPSRYAAPPSSFIAAFTSGGVGLPG
jgi:hypothetical protein